MIVILLEIIFFITSAITPVFNENFTDFPAAQWSQAINDISLILAMRAAPIFAGRSNQVTNVHVSFATYQHVSLLPRTVS